MAIGKNVYAVVGNSAAWVNLGPPAGDRSYIQSACRWVDFHNAGIQDAFVIKSATDPNGTVAATEAAARAYTGLQCVVGPGGQYPIHANIGADEDFVRMSDYWVLALNNADLIIVKANN